MLGVGEVAEDSVVSTIQVALRRSQSPRATPYCERWERRFLFLPRAEGTKAWKMLCGERLKLIHSAWPAKFFGILPPPFYTMSGSGW